jgi:hypothetical protein
LPYCVSEYTSADTRRVPLKSGTFNATRALPLASSCHRAGEQVDGLHPRRRSPRLRQCGQRHVATEADLGDAAFEALDHPAIDVVRIHAEAALGEEMRVRIRHREAGDVEDADIDRGHRDIACLPASAGALTVTCNGCSGRTRGFTARPTATACGHAGPSARRPRRPRVPG